jgi:hypothetical protein
MDYRRAFRSAAVSFADLIARVPADRWDSPGLGEWTVRELAGHAAGSALRRVPDVLGSPGDEVERASAVDYWLPPRTAADPGAAGRALGDDPAAVVGDLVGLATQALGKVEDDDVVATPAGGMRVRDWLPTRTFELVVYGLDVATAAGIEMFLAPEVVAEAVGQAAGIAAATGDGTVVLRALTGRGDLPSGFSVI